MSCGENFTHGEFAQEIFTRLLSSDPLELMSLNQAANHGVNCLKAAGFREVMVGKTVEDAIDVSSRVSFVLISSSPSSFSSIAFSRVQPWPPTCDTSPTPA